MIALEFELIASDLELSVYEINMSAYESKLGVYELHYNYSENEFYEQAARTSPNSNTSKISTHPAEVNITKPMKYSNNSKNHFLDANGRGHHVSRTIRTFKSFEILEVFNSRGSQNQTACDTSDVILAFVVIWLNVQLFC